MKMHMPNMELHALIHCLPFLLAILAVEAIESNSNATDSSRVSRSSRRVVRLYSGTRPEPIVCHGEGFQADPVNCAVFYRCMKSGKGRFMTFKFQCAPGTIFDPDTEVCNHPSSVKRSNCGIDHTVSVSEPMHDNVIEEIRQELPSPISTKTPFYTEIFSSSTPHLLSTSKKQDLSTSYPWATSTLNPNKLNSISKLPQINNASNNLITEPFFTSTKKQRSTTSRASSVTRKPSVQNGELCRSEGFMGDSENCRKFYRCISNLRGGYIRYEFMCTESTIWDDDIQSCNHAWAVKRRRCGRNNVNEDSEDPANKNRDVFQDDTNSKVTSNIKPVQHTFSTSKTSPISTYPSQSPFTTMRSSTTKVNTNMSNNVIDIRVDQDYSSSTEKRPNALPQDEESNSYNNMNTGNNDEPISDECSESGFNGDKNDCKKFYRCVDNGRGGYTKYEFSCGEGTVWDPNLEACNHAWAVKECGGKTTTHGPGTTTTSSPSTATSTKTTPASITTTQSTENTETDNEDTGYGNQNQNPSVSSTTTVSPLPSSSSQVTEQPGSNCSSSGFMGDENDCKIFYRCVDNGDGSFTQYKFTCGEGTVWDSSLEACNHIWAVKECGGKTTTAGAGTTTSNPGMITATSTQSTQGYISTYQTTTEEDENSGYGNQNPISSTTSTTTESPSSPSHVQVTGQSENNCSSSGFMGDKNDCKKFYRCVDKGDGTYIRYEFSCGDGTVWDPEIESCNHPWAVEKCGGSSIITTEKTEPSADNTIHTTQSTQNDDSDSGYGPQNDENSPSQVETSSSTTSTTTSTSNQPVDSSNNCISSGFMGDNSDCKKFYRCVDNGNGGFTRYEFTCGEGTVWDSEIEACNHAWAVKKCGGTQNNEINKEDETVSQEPTTSSSTSTTSNENEIDTGYGQSSSESTISVSPSEQNEVQASNECTSSGFMGDNNNCKKFYRCVENGNGGFTRYEFTCGDGTMWDQEIQACNHDNGRPCPNNGDKPVTKEPEHDEMNLDNNSTKETTTTERSTTQKSNDSQTSTQSTATCQSEGFYGDPNNCKKFYRCVDNGQGSFTKYEFTCGDGTVWDQEIQACNHESSSKCTSNNTNNTSSSNESQPTTNPTFTTISSSTEVNKNQSSPVDSSNDTCTSEGFFANSMDCKRFYRCVDNGKSGYTKYDFTCGDGTMWVQEIQACDHQDDANCPSTSTNKPQQSENQQSTMETQSSSTSASSTSTTADMTEKPQDEYQDNSTNVTQTQDNDSCSSEGFYPNKNNCKKFYRCVDNGQGGFTKYDFSCGEGTAWDSDIQTCNHISEVSRCQSENQEQNQNKPMDDEQVSQTSESNETQKPSTAESSDSNQSSSKDSCENEGYFGNTQDCTKFYRCVDNGKGGYTKYDFDCGEGTIWDQDITTCNHPQDVVNPSCKQTSETSSSSNTQTTTTTTQSSNTDNTSQQSSNCSQENTTKKPTNQNVTCDKAGYYANPNDCKKFYRCVDWDGNGERFSVYHFECGDGTIWDPQLDTCNHEDSVYPPRDCSGAQSQNENIQENSTSQQTTEATTTEQSTTEDTTTSQQSTTTEQSTTQQSTTTEQTTTQQSTTTEETTTQQSTTTEATTTQQTTTTTEGTTTQQSTTTDGTTTQQSTTTEGTTTQQSTTTDGTTTQQSTTTEGTTTQQSTTEGTTQQSTTTEETTTTTTTEGTTTSSTTEGTTTEQSTTTESTTTQQTTEGTTTQESTTTENSTTQESTTTDGTTTESTTNQSSTTDETTTQQSTTSQTSTTDSSESSESSTSTEESTDNQSTTESTEQTDDGSTTESTTEGSSSKECPDTEEDQYLYVCPTSFRRHPKYCNKFYQCTEDDENEPKIAMFTCPNNTIYDESKTQCVEESKADKKCDGQIAQRRRLKRLDKYYKEPITVGRDKYSCSSPGYYPFEKNSECSQAFLKCSKGKYGRLRGYVYQCPEGYLYWSISKRCERKESIRDCKTTGNDWSRRWEIPVERKNVA